MRNIQQFFKVKLIEVVREGLTAPSCLYMPEGDENSSLVGVSDLFLKDAITYHGRYYNPGHFEVLIQKALSAADISICGGTILDIGSGSGNTVVPALKIFKESWIVAADVSPDLLLILNSYVGQYQDFRNRLFTVCVDVGRPVFLPESFDLIIGAAILHHLIDPALVIQNMIMALKPGGSCIFFEPFESGYSLLRLAYLEILARATSMDPIEPRVLDFLQFLCHSYCIQAGKDLNKKSSIDDKWLFTKLFFESIAQKEGASPPIFFKTVNSDKIFTDKTVSNLKLGLGVGASALPEWAWGILDLFDNAFSDELKSNIIMEACVILKKSH